MNLPESAHTELKGLARSGTLNLVGGLVSAVIGLALIIALNTGLGLSRGGAVLSVVGLFQVVAAACTLGVDTGLIRAISGRHAQHGFDLRKTLAVALIPTIAVSFVVGLVGMFLAPAIGRMLGGEELSAQIGTLVKLIAPAVLLAAVFLALMGATRGFGTMRPTVFLERILRPLLQVTAVVVAGFLAGSIAVVGVGWTAAYLAVLVLAVIWLRRITRRDEHPSSESDWRAIAGPFWRFTLPRSAATTFRVALQWLDVVFVGALLSPAAAIIYGTATRLLQFGVLAAFSLSQAIEPRLGKALAEGRSDDAMSLYQIATAWLVLLTWPVYIVVTWFAPGILSLFGPDFVAGADVVTILVVSVMFGAAAGPVDILLLMAGKSSWSLANTAASLGTNVILNVVLIPRWGIAGAATAWSVSRILANLLPLVQTARGLRLKPFSSRLTLAMGTTAVIFGGLATLVRLTLGSGSVVGAVAAAAVGSLIYVLVLRRLSGPLDLRALPTLWARRKGEVLA